MVNSRGRNVDKDYVSRMTRIVSSLGGRSSEDRGRSRWDRVLLATVLSAVAMLLLVGVVFSVVHGSRQITSNAEDLHTADETLRTATVARAQLALAVYMSAIGREFGVNSADALDVSLSESNEALDRVREGLGKLTIDREETIQPLAAAVEEFVAAGEQISALIQSNDSRGAQHYAELNLDQAFGRAVPQLVGLRDDLNAQIKSSGAFLGTLQKLTSFLVAFLIPAAVILIYRELIRRQQRQAELETRLEAERQIGHAREEFIANASHELRTPLTGIHGLAMLLEEEPAIKQSEMAAELIGLIVSESADLGRMVEDLLTTARLDAGALHYTFEDIQILDEVAEVIEPMRRAGMSIDVDCEPGMIRCDRLRFRQVLRNLLSNARKYGGPNVRVSGVLESHSYVCAVLDDGQGIPTELEDRLFERFIHQGQQTAVKESVGLGLSIVRSLIEGMGGTVYYERELEETAFVIVLPLATGAPVETQVAVSPHRQQGSAELQQGPGEAMAATELQGLAER